jgi:Domain of unknown function (DUF5625)
MNIYTTILTAVFLLSACSTDMKPPRPYALPFDLNQAGNTASFDIEVLANELGVGLIFMFHHSDKMQREYLRSKVCEDALQPSSPVSSANPRTGLIIPTEVRFIRGDTVLFNKILQTKGCLSGSAGDVGWFDRSISGMVLPKGKYRIEVKNIEAQPAFQKHRVEIRIPSDRKV